MSVWRSELNESWWKRTQSKASVHYWALVLNRAMAPISVLALGFFLGIGVLEGSLFTSPQWLKSVSIELGAWVTALDLWLRVVVGVVALLASLELARWMGSKFDPVSFISTGPVRGAPRSLIHWPRVSWKKILWAFAGLYVALIVVHVANGFAPGEGFGMAIRDLRAIASCPHKPKEYWAFIDRSQLESLSAGLAQLLGVDEDLYGAVCEGAFVGPGDQRRAEL